MKKHYPLFLLTLITISSINSGAACPESEFVEFNVPGGKYMRVHPDGNHLLMSGGAIHLIDITDKSNPRVTRTAMNDETAPIQSEDGGWRWLASPNHSGTMKYFDFKKLLENPRNGTPAFEDSTFNQFYHSAAELPGSTKNLRKIRTSLWSPTRFRDYEVEVDNDGNVTKVTPGVIKNLCPNLRDQSFAEPYISTNGTEVAAETYNRNGGGNGGWGARTRQIYKIKDDGTCDLVDDLKVDTSKMVFDYPKDGKKGLVTFTSSRSLPSASGDPAQRVMERVWVYDRDTGKSYPISGDNEYVQYGGFTKDGRVIYQSIKTERSMMGLGSSTQKSGVSIVKIQDAINCQNTAATSPAGDASAQ